MVTPPGPARRSTRGAEVCIVEAVRTPVGRGSREKGIFGEVHPADLLGRVFVELLERAGVDSSAVDNVIAGCVYQIAEQAAGIARTAWLQKGLAESTGATTIDVRCGSGLQAINFAALRIAAGVDDVVVAGGVEHMGRVGFPVNNEAMERWGHPFTDELVERYPLVSQGVGAEMIAEQWGVERPELDEIALRSHRLAHGATESGAFGREILGIDTGTGIQTVDQGIRPGTSLEALGALPSVFRADGRITAGNSSQVSDGAAAVLLMSAERTRAQGLTPRAVILDQVVLGANPVTMLTGPIPATRKILKRNGLAMSDVDYVEINEAFASVLGAWGRELEVDMERVNPRGGAIALGHPLGATGARLVTTLLHELEDDDKELGLVTMCCGGGIGMATLLHRVG